MLGPYLTAEKLPSAACPPPSRPGSSLPLVTSLLLCLRLLSVLGLLKLGGALFRGLLGCSLEVWLTASALRLTSLSAGGRLKLSNDFLPAAAKAKEVLPVSFLVPSAVPCLHIVACREVLCMPGVWPPQAADCSSSPAVSH